MARFWHMTNIELLLVLLLTKGNKHIYYVKPSSHRTNAYFWSAVCYTKTGTLTRNI